MESRIYSVGSWRRCMLGTVKKRSFFVKRISLFFSISSRGPEIVEKREKALKGKKKRVHRAVEKEKRFSTEIRFEKVMHKGCKFFHGKCGKRKD